MQTRKRGMRGRLGPSSSASRLATSASEGYEDRSCWQYPQLGIPQDEHRPSCASLFPSVHFESVRSPGAGYNGREGLGPCYVVDLLYFRLLYVVEGPAATRHDSIEV